MLRPTPHAARRTPHADVLRPLPVASESRVHDGPRGARGPEPAADVSAERRAAAALARVAHDLRGPLAAIELATDLLLQGMAKDPARDAERLDMEVIRDAARGMQRLAADLLDEAAIASGRVTLRRAAVAPATLVADAARLLGGWARVEGVRLVTDAPAALPPVLADRDRVLQVLGNLIENAIAHSAPGTVEVQATRVAPGVAFAVRDAGPGIPPEALPHVFEPFWRAPDDTRRGTGLGLAIARSLVEAHGGTIDVRSAVGQGSTFVFTLPGAGTLCQNGSDTRRRL